MAQESKSDVAEKKAEVKTIPLSDLLAYKKGASERERKLKAQLAEMETSVKSLQEELEVAGTNVEDDEEVKSVRQFLLKQKRELDQRESKLNKDLTDFQEREKSVRAKELATEYGIDVASLVDEDDIEGAALRIRAEKLAEENKALKEAKEKVPETETPKVPETKPIYESGVTAVVRKNISDMTHDEFVKYENDLKAKVGLR